MKLADAPKVLLTNPTLVRVPGRLATPFRILPIPSFTSSIESALTKSPWPFIAACQRSSTPELSGRVTDGYGCGHCRAPLLSAVSVAACWPDSLPAVPIDSAAKFRCCQLAEYLPLASGGVLLTGALSVHNGHVRGR